MTILDAVRLVLTKAGQPPPDMLDPNGPGSTSDVAEAQFYLEREARNVLARGWSQNIEESVTVYPPTDKIAVTGTSTLIVGERITEAVTGAYGPLQAIVNEAGINYAYIARQSAAAFTGVQNLTGESSGNTRVGGARTAVADNKLRRGTDWIEVRQADDEVKELTTRDPYLYDLTGRRFTFTGPVKLRLVLDMPVDQLSHKLANLCALKAAKEYQSERRGGVRDDAWITKAIELANTEAEDEDRTQRRTNTLATTSSYRMSGRRRPTGWNEGERYA